MARTSFRGALLAGMLPFTTTRLEPGSRVSVKSDFTSAAEVVTSFWTVKSGVAGVTAACTGFPACSPGVSVSVTTLSSTTIAEMAAPYSHTMSSISQPFG